MRAAMSRLHVALQDGFAHEPVRVSIEGVEVYHVADVNTLPHSGLADRFETEVADGDVTLDVVLPKRSPVNQAVHLHVTEESWLAISLDGSGRVQHWMSLTPLG
jgi:hypothetical protein